MTAEEFVANFKAEKDISLSLYLSDEPTEVSERFKALESAQDKRKAIEGIIDTILTDTYYSILLGLDGAASIGDEQQGYTIHDEEGSVITDAQDGELEGLAWEAFHG
ncbi:hypothetical protein HW115_19050 [Verrucomicrobiaceae bacterium N1E253]|uniref:Uncharacterized protein n=1 Tax=Oceaniferula marina TaxID=2748318 RepID=A0A851GTT3_9BACT|nr:hypothetical protein [Oceaniferula marina]NWK57724.1 hypothetical protein [Oceaniferula marina]